MIFLASRAPDCVRHVAERARAVVARGGGRGARRASGGRFARPHAPHVATARRAVALAVLALVLLVPTVAHAEIVHDPLPNTGDGLVAPWEFSVDGRFCAAGEVIGRSYDGLTAEQQAYIREYDDGSGSNAFTEFANKRLANVAYEPSPNTTALVTLFPFFVSNYGNAYVWYFQTLTDEELQGAQAAFDEAWNSWLNENGYGDGVSGDGASSLDGRVLHVKVTSVFADWVLKPGETEMQHGTPYGFLFGTTYYVNTTPSYTWRSSSGTTYDVVPFTGVASFDVTVGNSSLDDTYDYYVIATANSQTIYYDIYAFKQGSYTLERDTYEGSVYNSTFSVYRIHVDSETDYYYYSGYKAYKSSWFDGTDVTAPTSFGSVNFSKYTSADDIILSPTRVPQNGYMYGTTKLVGGNPTYPDPPQPPEIPEPDPPETKPIDDPGITLPPINFPDLVLPDIDYTVETPTGTDVVPYLKKIIANQEDIAEFLSAAISIIDEDLDNIGEALGEHCNHIQQQMQKQVYWLAQELQDMFDGLEVGISNYLYRVQTKLLQGIGWEFDNLSQDVISWLKRIYSRLGGNGISKPDPTTDTKGFWDWLVEQFTKFFAELLGKSTSGLNSLFDSLKEFFPFSLPWDIVALLGLFVHEPVTPVFDLPMPVPQIISGSQMQLIHVDCHQWDATMQIVRSLEFVFFAYHLMRMVPSWFNEIKVAGM